jgi:hypothetical protein
MHQRKRKRRRVSKEELALLERLIQEDLLTIYVPASETECGYAILYGAVSCVRNGLTIQINLDLEGDQS